MPHVKPLRENAPEESKSILKAIEDKFGHAFNIFCTMAYQPDVLGGCTQINNGIREDLPEQFRELAYFKSSQVNGCDYCSHYHKQAAEKAGVTDEQLAAIGNYATSAAFDDQEKAILAYAEQLTSKSDVDDETVAKVRSSLTILSWSLWRQQWRWRTLRIGSITDWVWNSHERISF